MNNMAIVGPMLSEARDDLEEATNGIAAYYGEKLNTDAMERLAISIKALTRATSTLTLAVERLAELPVNA